MNNNYINYLASQQRSENTIKAYTRHIESMLEFIGKPENEIEYMDLVNWKVSINSKSSATVAQAIAAVKDYFKFMKKAKFISENPAEDLETVAVNNKKKFALQPEEIRAMIKYTTSLKNKAIIITMASTGLRISELSSLTREQYENRIGDAVIVKGKGNKERKVYFADEVCEYINTYLSTRDDDSEYLFVTNEGNKLLPNNVTKMLKTAAKRAGVQDWDAISNHYMRTAFATMQSENGTPIEVVQELLGHSNINTTRRYECITEKRAKEAMKSLCF